MLIKKQRWLLVAALYVVGPIMGLILGVFGGLYLVDQAHEDVDGAAVVESADTDDVASDAKVTMPHGSEASLDELVPGMKLAVVVMKDADCPVCQRQLKRMSDDLRQFERRGGTVMGLSDADPATNRHVMRTLGLDVPIASDSDHEVLKKLGMTLPERPHVMPGIVFVDENGEIEDVHQGRAPGRQQCQQKMVLDWLDG